jgi:hypothetical protein
MSKNKGQRNPNETALRGAEPNRTTNRTEGQDKDPKPFYKKYKFWTLVVVIIYSITTVALWVQTKRATEASKISADAEVATVRAWVVVGDWKWNAIPSYDDVTASKWAPADFTYSNIGHTPATNPKLATMIFLYHPDGSPDPQFPLCPNVPVATADRPEARQNMVIIPSAGVAMHWTCTLPPDQYDALSHGHASLYLAGCMWYNVVSSDQFGVTQYCVEWKPDGRMEACHAYNTLK